MKNKILTVIALLTIALLSGCATGEATKTTATTYAPSDPKAVEILFEKPERQYEVIGFVSGTAAQMASQEAVFNAMREEAAKIGADAIYIRSDIKQGDYWQNYHKSGDALAIKWKDRLPAKLPIKLEK